MSDQELAELIIKISGVIGGFITTVYMVGRFGEPLGYIVAIVVLYIVYRVFTWLGI